MRLLLLLLAWAPCAAGPLQHLSFYSFEGAKNLPNLVKNWSSTVTFWRNGNDFDGVVAELRGIGGQVQPQRPETWPPRHHSSTFSTAAAQPVAVGAITKRLSFVVFCLRRTRNQTAHDNRPRRRP